ncbi:MAG: chemotaxis protein CheW [Thiotrichales bacterium]
MKKQATAIKSATEYAGDGDQFVTFNLGDEMCAIPLSGVKEIIEYGGVTPVPTMPEFIRGVINLRGRVVPVIDLSARLGRVLSSPTRRTCIIIVEIEGLEESQDMGVVVDNVNSINRIATHDIEPPPSFGMKMRVDFINGMWRAHDRFLIILDVGKVLSMEEISTLAEVATTAPAPRVETWKAASW